MEKQIEKTLKFRCLDTETNQWFYFTLEQLAHGEADKIGHRLDCWGQWTGLTGKNEVEIYEGDIIKITPNKLGAEERIIKIDFENHHIGDFFNWEIRGFRDYSKSTYGNIVDVVGNIHQNPEILK